ncbi:ROK family protein [Halanaerobium saccharolyticum]|uniref:Glucokinase n=1 Tax=Halanaerobium saccharolyticum TaxID=43595 RepID=A0A4R6SEZ1_9FIRM|nr:ROK family protein [Halanaerobium saccharolyticum]TDP98203.1 glucokinase [Halanaerobium saccharolyticum]
MNNKIAIGIDIGGTKINIAAVKDSGEIVKLKKINTPANDRKELLKILIENIKIFVKEFSSYKGIGIATAGRVIFEEKKIAYTTDNLKDWDKSDLINQLSSHFSKNIYLDNDVNAALLAEINGLKDIKNKNIIFITIGTGLGGALAVDGKIVRGNTGSAGEFGHMVLYPEGRNCNCGKKGCAEQYISGKAYQKRLKEKLKESKIAVNKNSLSIDRIEIEIKKEKGLYYQVLKEMIKDLSLLLENLKNAVDYDLCILGGSFSAYDKIILKLIKEYTEEYQSKYYSRSNHKFSDHKDKAGVIGAALMVFKQSP